MESTSITENSSAVHETTGLISINAVTIKSIDRGNKNNTFDLRRIITVLPYWTAAIGISLVLVIVRVSVHQGMLSNGLFPFNTIVNQGTSGGLKKASKPYNFELNGGYQAALKAGATKKAPINKFIHETVTVKFPPGVFDIKKANDVPYMMQLSDRCYTALAKDSSDPRHVLACKTYFDSASRGPRMALGTLELGTDILTMLKKGEYKKTDIHKIFVPEALAVMIDKHCFQFTFDANDGESRKYQYDSSSSYASSITEDGSIDIKASAGYGPITLNAGYSNEKSTFTGHKENYSFTFGTKSVRKSLGVLENLCLTEEYFFIIKDNGLIEQHVIDNWNDITKERNPNTNYINGAEKETVDGGFLMPQSYSYDLYAKYDIRMSSMGTSQVDRNNNKEAISAGFDLSFGAGSAGGSVEVEVEKAVKEKSSSSKKTVTVHVSIIGSNIATKDCFKNTHESCESIFNREIVLLRNDINQWVGGPVNHKTFVSIKDLSKWYNAPSPRRDGVDGQGIPYDFNARAEKYISGCDQYYSGSCTDPNDYDLDSTESSSVCCPPYKMLGTRPPTISPTHPPPTPPPTAPRTAKECQIYCYNCFTMSNQEDYIEKECEAGCYGNRLPGCSYQGNQDVCTRAWFAGYNFKHIWTYNSDTSQPICKKK